MTQKVINKPSHYEVLGVKPDAEPEEIKRAYRKLATNAHPDKATGNHKAMAALAIAYEVLSDPERRDNYDKTGADQLPRTEERIASMVMGAFSDGLAKGATNILKNAHHWIESYKAKLVKQKTDLEEVISMLKERREKINTATGANLFHMVTDQNIKQVEQNIIKTDADLAVCDCALQRLSEYESSEAADEVSAITYTTRLS